MIPDFKTFIKESIWSDIQDRSMGKTVREEDYVSYSDLNNKDCTVDLLYKYLINNYEVLGDEQIKLNSGEDGGDVWYEVHVPITLSGENIETELSADDVKSIWSIDFTTPLMKYVERMKTVVEIDDYLMNSDTYARAYTKTDPVLCSEVVDFIDEILKMVPDPALRKRIIKKKERRIKI